jgi:hypothetical protein
MSITLDPVAFAREFPRQALRLPATPRGGFLVRPDGFSL